MSFYKVPEEVDAILERIASRHRIAPGIVLSAAVSVLDMLEKAIGTGPLVIDERDISDLLSDDSASAGRQLRVVPPGRP